MKKRIYVKDKSFLKHFITIALLLLSITVIIVISVYRMSLRALEQEIKNLNQNTCYEMNDRLKGILEQCNQFAAHLVTDDKVQLFFIQERPEYLVENYYAELAGKMQAYGISYIDSVLLYAPKYEKYFSRVKYTPSGGEIRAYTLSEIERNSSQVFDISWMDHMDTQERTTTKIFTRAKADRWPYYITIMKQYRSGVLEGVVLINMDLEELYEELIAGRDESVQIYIVDEEQRVILKENKRELFTPLDRVESLSGFVPQATFCQILEQGDSRYAYAQVYSEDYGFTCVVLSELEDYGERIIRVQKRFIEIAFAAAAAAVFLACLYSVKLIRPLQDIRMLLDDSARDRKDMKYSEEIQDIAEQIMLHLQTNGALREELDRRLALLKNTQMIALRSQINPHFLFNTLNVISVMIESDYGDGQPAARMIGELSEILRYSLSENEIVSLGLEIEYVKKYLDLMQYRYDGFSVSINVEPDMYLYAVPKLFLQPLIENALQHGISACLGIRDGYLKITICQTDDVIREDGAKRSCVLIEIRDNGIGIDEEHLEELRKTIAAHDSISQKNIGLSNVVQRLYLLFQDEQQVTIDSVFGKGTCVRILFPANRYEDSTNMV